jgi:hypothetical protein
MTSSSSAKFRCLPRRGLSLSAGQNSDPKSSAVPCCVSRKRAMSHLFCRRRSVLCRAASMETSNITSGFVGTGHSVSARARSSSRNQSGVGNESSRPTTGSGKIEFGSDKRHWPRCSPRVFVSSLFACSNRTAFRSAPAFVCRLGALGSTPKGESTVLRLPPLVAGSGLSVMDCLRGPCCVCVGCWC